MVIFFKNFIPPAFQLSETRPVATSYRQKLLILLTNRRFELENTTGSRYEQLRDSQADYCRSIERGKAITFKANRAQVTNETARGKNRS